ncbi:MAG: NYN domain-containing protein [Opitutales bacterium]
MPDRHLLIDAYNVIHAWPQLRAALIEFGPDAARAQLADAVRPLHDVAGWRVSLVFDGKGDDLVIERPGPELTFSYVYGPRGLTADAIIEQVVLNSTVPPPDLARTKHSPASSRKNKNSPTRPALSQSKGRPAQDPAPRSFPALDPDKEIVVVTRDNLLSEATAASGARTLSPDGLRDWVNDLAAQQTRQLLARHRRTHADWKSAISPWDKLPKPPTP